MSKDFAGGYLIGVAVGALMVGLIMMSLYNQDLKQANRILQKELSANRYQPAKSTNQEPGVI